MLQFWQRKHMIQLYAVYKPRFAIQRHKAVEMEKTEERLHTNSNQKTAKTATLVLDKIRLNQKMLQETKGNYILLKGSIQQEDIWNKTKKWRNRQSYS